MADENLGIDTIGQLPSEPAPWLVQIERIWGAVVRGLRWHRSRTRSKSLSRTQIVTAGRAENVEDGGAVGPGHEIVRDTAGYLGNVELLHLDWTITDLEATATLQDDHPLLFRMGVQSPFGSGNALDDRHHHVVADEQRGFDALSQFSDRSALPGMDAEDGLARHERTPWFVQLPTVYALSRTWGIGVARKLHWISPLPDATQPRVRAAVSLGFIQANGIGMLERTAFRFAVTMLLGSALLTAQCPQSASAQSASPFDKLAGRWTGEGRLGMRGGSTETVKCRATYFVDDGGNQLRQNIRCASSSGSIEIASLVVHAAGALTGSWKELSRNMGGELAGVVNANGFKVAVRGSDLSANMDIIVKGTRQIIEIQFSNSTLIGLTLLLTKADAPLSNQASSAAPSR